MKGSALSMQFQRGIRPNAKLILEALERGEDPLETVPIGSEAKGAGAKGQIFYLQNHKITISFCSTEPEIDIDDSQRSKNVSAPMPLLAASNSSSQLASRLTLTSSMMPERMESIARTSL